MSDDYTGRHRADYPAGLVTDYDDDWGYWAANPAVYDGDPENITLPPQASDEDLDRLRETLHGNDGVDFEHRVRGAHTLNFVVAALLEAYSPEEIKTSVDFLDKSRPEVATAYSVYVERDGSTLVNTEVAGVKADREPSTDDIRRSARDVEEFHSHQRVAAMVRALAPTS